MGTHQRRSALAEAERVRLGRAQLKREIRAGRVTIEDLILSPPDIIHRVKLSDLLLWRPFVGRVRAKGILHEARASAELRLENAGPATRERVVKELVRRYAEGPSGQSMVV